MIEFRSTGSAYARGLAHGRRFGPLIEEHIDAACRIEAGWEEQIQRFVDTLEGNLRRHAPAQLEELSGIAAGAGLELTALLRLNYWPEVTSATVGLRFCSLVTFADAGGGPIIGKTSDHPLVSLRFLALQRVDAETGHSYIRGTFVGTLGTRAGINDAGLALCGATIVPKATNTEGLPVMVTMQAMLEQCRTVGEAIALAEQMPAVNYGAHIMLGDAGGDVAVIERLPDRLAVRRPVEGLLLNTNHPLAPETRDQDNADASLNQNSHARFDNLQRLVPGAPRTVAGMQAILRDHSRPGAICQHGPGDLHTTSAYVLLPAQGHMLMAAGCPCAHDFVPLRVE